MGLLKIRSAGLIGDKLLNFANFSYLQKIIVKKPINVTKIT